MARLYKMETYILDADDKHPDMWSALEKAMEDAGIDARYMDISDTGEFTMSDKHVLRNPDATRADFATCYFALRSYYEYFF